MMNVGIKVVVTGVLAFVLASLVISMTIDWAATSVKEVDNSNPMVSTLKQWSGRFLILAVGTLIALIILAIPTPFEVKGLALLLEFLGGAIMWLMA